MRHSPQSPAGSVSSCGTSPVNLHALWNQGTGANRTAPLRHCNDSDNSNTRITTTSSSNNNNNNELVDDDLFGSAAWRKKRGTKRGGAKARQEKGDQDHHHGGKPGKHWAAVCLLGKGAQALKSRVEVVRGWLGGAWMRVVSPPSAPEPAAPAPVVDGGVSKTTVPEPGSYELTNEVLVQQARLLCGNYINHRLSSKGLMCKRVHVAPYHSLVSEELCSAGQELERLYPRVYSDVSRRIAMTMSSAQLVRRMLTSVLEGTFKTGVTWAKLVSMVVISAAFAEECVVQGHPNFVEDVVMCVGHFVQLHLTGWLVKQGGWSAFPTSRPPMPVKPSPRSSLLLYTGLALFTVAILVLTLIRLYLGSTQRGLSFF